MPRISAAITAFGQQTAQVTETATRPNSSLPEPRISAPPTKRYNVITAQMEARNQPTPTPPETGRKGLQHQTREGKPLKRLPASVTQPMLFPTTLTTRVRKPQKGCFNDDVKLEHYQPAALSFADKQRRGIHESFDGCADMHEHIRRAMKQPSPMAYETPLPDETSRAAEFIAEYAPRDLTALWDSQLLALGKLPQAAAPEKAVRGKNISPDLRPAAWKVQVLALQQLADFCGLGASRWLDQFAVGLPITGRL